MIIAPSKTRWLKLISIALLLLMTLAMTTAAMAQGRSPKPIRLISGNYFPEIVSPTRAKALPQASFDGKQFNIIQFVDIPSDAQRQRWARAGLHLVDYLPDDAYFAVIDADFDLASLGNEVITIINVADRFKVEAELAAQQKTADFAASKLVVSYYATLNPQRVIADLEARGAIIEAHRHYSRQLDIVIKPWQLDTILRLPYLQFVGPEPAEGVPEPLDYRNSSGRSNYLNTNYNGLNYTGDGVVIAIGEGDTAGDHIDFKGRLIEFSSGDPGSHKIPVMQNGGGAGNLDPTNRNNALGATLISTSGGLDYAALHDSHDLRFSNHSLGYGIAAGYDSTARDHDLRTATYPLHLVIYSAGNSGSATGFAPYDGFSGWANLTGQRKQNKNHFGIGALNASDSVTGFSSRGPMYDGRVYPQLIIEGGGGTSFAAPKITGLLAILSEAFQDLNSGTEPPASLLRAILMNTADEVDNPGPDYKSGYGRPNMRRAYDVIDNSQYLTDSVAHGGSNAHVITVPANTEQVRVMIVWPDVAASVNANPAIVNNLDLLLTDPAATTSYNPWVLDHTANPTNLDTPATRQVDSLNTIEQVTVDNPAAGNWTINVTGTNVPMGPQTYYLVYEFLMDELLMAFPLENERFVPGDTYRIKWDSYNTAGGTFTLDYQLDGGSWVNVATGHDASSRNYDWTAPDVGTGIHTIKFRVQRGGLAAESGVNYIGKRPLNLTLDWACADTVKLSWETVAGATDYTVYRLGAKYMEPVTSNITFDGTTAVLTGLSTSAEESFAVAAVTTANEGMRTAAITKAVGDLNCFNVKTTTASSVDKTDITLNGLVNPHNSTLTAVYFEYGPTNAYGSTTANIPISATGHDEEAVSATIASTLVSRTDVIHYRLVATKDGSPVLGADQEIRLAPGNDFTFDGSDDYIDLSSHTTLPIYTGGNSYSISFWVKGPPQGNAGHIYSEGNTLSDDPTFGFFPRDTDQIRVFIRDDSNSTRLHRNSTAVVFDDMWHHVAWVDNGGTATLYIDGVADATNFNYTPTTTTFNTAAIGARIDVDVDSYFTGRVEELTVWDKALTVTEIRDLMHQPLVGNEPNLQAYYHFDGESTRLFDAVSGSEGAINGGSSKTSATAPFGVGAEFTATEASGSVTFTGTDLTANYSSHNSATVIAAKIEVEPNTTSGIVGGSTIFDAQYWVVHRHGSGSFVADVTFAIAEDLTAADATAPAQIQLLSREKGSDGDWSVAAVGSSVDAANDEVTFNGVSSFDKQFIIVRNTDPLLSVAESELPFANMKVGNTQQHAYTLRGVNLTADLIVTPPAGFLVSTNSSSGFVTSLTLTPSSGQVSETIYVRHTPAAVGTASGTVVNSSSGASAASVPITQFAAVVLADYATEALDFDGSDDYLQVQNFDWNPSSVFTVEWWLKPDTHTNWNQQVGNGWGNFLFHTNSTGTVSAGVANNGSSRINSAAGELVLGEWQHFAFTLDGSNAKLYKNGELLGEKTGSNGINTTWGTFDIGKNSSSTINGQIDEFRIWSTARTQQEIRDNMHNVLLGNEAGLELYLQFNAATGDVVDLSSNGYAVATLNGPTRATSTAAVGTAGELVNTQTETAVGDVGKQLKTTITSTPSTTDYLGIYRTGEGTQLLFGETYPAGITWRADIFWGVQAFGAVTADLVIDYSTVSGIGDASAVKLLKRTDVTMAWTDVTADFVHDMVNRTFTKTGETSFSEFAIAGGLTAVSDTYNMPAGTTLTVPAGGVLGNDFGAEGSITAVLDTAPASGSLTLNNDGSFDYTPPAAFTGSVTFTYHTNDGSADSNIATATINVIGSTLSLAAGSGTEADLSWVLVPTLTCQYDVYRSSNPYSGFANIADDWNALTFSDTGGAVGTVGTDYFYYIEVVNCPGTTLTAPKSDTVGEFDFAIVPGS